MTNRLFPNLDEQEVSDVVSGLMAKIGIAPELIYAWEKCGFLVTDMNVDGYSDEDMAEWNAAIDEYKAKHQ